MIIDEKPANTKQKKCEGKGGGNGVWGGGIARRKKGALPIFPSVGSQLKDHD